MSTNALAGDAVLDVAADLEDDDRVHLARSGYAWASPMAVQDVDCVEWTDGDGNRQFRSARIELTSTSNRGPSTSTPHVVTALDGAEAEWSKGNSAAAVVRFDPVGSGGSDSDGAADDDVTDQTPPHTSAIGTGELTPAVRPLDEDRDGAGHPDGVDDPDTGSEDALERDYDQDLVVEDLDEVSEVRGRSLRQQVRAADGDVSDERLAVQIGATIEVVQVLRSEVEAIEGRPDRGADAESASVSPASAPDSSPSSGGPLRCQNCGAHVSRSYAAVFTPEDVEQPRACPSCPDKIRKGDGSVRDARSSRTYSSTINRLLSLLRHERTERYRPRGVRRREPREGPDDHSTQR